MNRITKRQVEGAFLQLQELLGSGYYLEKWSQGDGITRYTVRRTDETKAVTANLRGVRETYYALLNMRAILDEFTSARLAKGAQRDHR